jgi:hypothetical protein
MRGFYEQGPLPKLETDPKKIRKAYPKMTAAQSKAHVEAVKKAIGPGGRIRETAVIKVDLTPKAGDKVIAGLKDALKKKPVKGRREETLADWRAAKKNDPRVTDAQAAKLAKKLGPAVTKGKVRSLIDEVMEDLKALSKKRSRS